MADYSKWGYSMVLQNLKPHLRTCFGCGGQMVSMFHVLFTIPVRTLPKSKSISSLKLFEKNENKSKSGPIF